MKTVQIAMGLMAVSWLIGCAAPTPQPVAQPKPRDAPKPQAPTTKVFQVSGPNGQTFECTSLTPVYPQILIRLGEQGIVRAKAWIVNGRAELVEIISGPEQLHEVVKNAMMATTCQKGAPDRFWAEQRFVFRVEEPKEKENPRSQ